MEIRAALLGEAKPTVTTYMEHHFHAPVLSSISNNCEEAAWLLLVLSFV